MVTPLPSKPKLAYERTFNDIVHTKPLLFRLHCQQSSQTLFHREDNVLVASLYKKKLRPLSTAQEETPPEEAAVEKHITSWHTKTKEPSSFISLTFNILYVFWEWKRRMYFRQDDFIIIVLKGSELRVSGRAKLGAEWLQREKHKRAFKFAESQEEVIVNKFIQSEAILGWISMSELEDFIPSWYQQLLESAKTIPGSEEKMSFQKSLRILSPEVDKVDNVRARESLGFALAILAPMLVQGEQRRTDNGGVVGCNAIEQPRAEGVTPKIEPHSGHEAVSGQMVAEDGGVLVSCRKRNHSPEIGSQYVGTTEDSSRQEPLAKRRRLSKEENAVRSADVMRDAQVPVESFNLKWESECIGKLATELCRVKWKRRPKCQDLFTVHGRELLGRFRTEVKRNLKPRGNLVKMIMDDYKAWGSWDIGTS